MLKIRRQVALLSLLSFASISAFAADTLTVCNQIKSAVSSESSVAYPPLIPLPGDQYTEDISHWASSSSQPSKCTVRPGTTGDLSKIVQILGSNKTPFAVKGGGHATNPGFSSTPGVLISMSRFSEVTYDQGSQTVVVGSGLIWDDVYRALEPHDVTVAGGRLTGVGVGGFSVGGGYSFITNQHGLTMDNIVAYELVFPNGTITQVTAASDSELFWGLKGGMNNFGIVTKYTMKTYPNNGIWGGIIWYLEPNVDAASAAVAKFLAENKDPKASVIAMYHAVDNLIPVWSLIVAELANIGLVPPSQGGLVLLTFYDGPEPPAGTFDSFKQVPYFYENLKQRDYVSLVNTLPTNITYGFRTTFETVPIHEVNANVLNVVRNETQFWSKKLSGQAAALYFVEPFHSDYLSHSPTDTAWPFTRDTSYTPFLMAYVWPSSLSDNAVYDAIKSSSAQIRNALIADGQPDPEDAPKYPNYAITGTPLEKMYGGNLGRLRDLKQKVDPNNIMGLTGGWRF